MPTCERERTFNYRGWFYRLADVHAHVEGAQVEEYKI